MSSNLVDAGGTPLWYPPASILEESSLRSTLVRHDKPGVESRRPSSLREAAGAEEQMLAAVAQRSLEYTHTSFNPINQPANPPCDKPTRHDSPVPRITPTTTELFRQHYGRQIECLHIDMYELGAHEVATIDHQENRVYHIGLNTGGSYSGRFENKPLVSELQALLAGALASTAERESKTLRYKEGAKMEQMIRAHLNAGGKLIVEQTSASAEQNAGIECHLPGCLARSKSIPPTNFYLDLQHTSSEGHYNDGSLQHPGVQRRSPSTDESVTLNGSPVKEPGDIPQLDGVEAEQPGFNGNGGPVRRVHEIEEPNGHNGGLQASRWAHAKGEVPQASPARLPTPEPGPDKATDDTTPDSPASIDSTGQWQHPPRRFQYIASFIEPSATLPAEYRAAVFLWKAASKTQLSWEQHLHKLKSLRVDHTGDSLLAEQIEKDFQIEDDDYNEEEIRAYEHQTGSRKKDCYGNVLSVVLAWVKKQD
ncbi:hypothetical protein CB0940_02563 [Cercospora beticola]|uniref:Uncharacterized protein n=1 Tax=Cercospora beticola TaxID=122368 RepID=A0A2G5I390_CERBT|nr:hypothetical protein CB0940_02563 [Cercospora beticola]PIA99208.1 hypothetical protein CB0940_02563 [Cercospora beticola]WPA99704.1 hypothetical protein RHO25_004323 [Cercospora beticola]